MDNVKTLQDLADGAQQDMDKVVVADNPLREFFVNYVGNKFSPENGEVTVDMCIRALAEDFPEFLSPLAEQNFMLGYLQCEQDIKSLMDESRKETLEIDEE